MSSDAAVDVILDFADLPPLVPDGVYCAVYVRHEIVWVFRTPKLFAHFRITDPGEHFGKTLYRAYRVKAAPKKGGRSGQIKVRRGQDLFEMLFRVLPIKLRPDRISLDALKSKILRIRTRTVTQDYRQRSLSEHLRYSVVDDVLSVETD